MNNELCSVPEKFLELSYMKSYQFGFIPHCISDGEEIQA